MIECAPLGKNRNLLLVSATLGMDSARTDWNKFSAELLTAEPLENKTGQSLPVCLSVSGDKKCVTLTVCVCVCAVPLPLTYFPLCACRSSGATLIRVLSALLRPNPRICSEF